MKTKIRRKVPVIRFQKEQKPAGLAGFSDLYFKISKSGGVNLTFSRDLYLPFIEGVGMDL